MSNKLTIDIENVLKTVREHPESKEYLISLFPELEEALKDDNRIFCKVGDILVRQREDSTPYSIIGVFMNEDGTVGVKNLQSGDTWHGVLHVKNIHDGITYTEFRLLTGYKDLTKFVRHGRIHFFSGTNRGSKVVGIKTYHGAD